MKLLESVFQYGNESAVRLNYSGLYFFEGTPPKADSLIFLNLPGLDKLWPEEDVRKWFSEYRKQEEFSRKDLIRISSDLWRPGKIEDLMEVSNYYNYNFTNYFSQAEFQGFLSDKVPRALSEMKYILLIKDEKRKLSEAKVFQPTFAKYCAIMNLASSKIGQNLSLWEDAIERKIFTELKNRNVSDEELLKEGNQLSSANIRRELLRFYAERQIGKKISGRELLEKILIIQNYTVLRKDTEIPGHEFWRILLPHLQFEANTFNESFDITNAEETTPVLNWDFINAKRIGPVVPGRSALSIPGSPHIYIRGERKLKFRIQKSGGKKDLFQNTLTVQTEKNSLSLLLLETEKIIALSSLAPKQAVRLADPLNLPRDHILYLTAEEAEWNSAKARILADLLIELLAGIDSDTARKLVRQEKRSNRR